MADPITLTAAAVSLASAGFGAASTMSSARGKSAADKYQAGQEEISATYARAQASQTDTYMQQDLAKSLSTINAVSAGTGASPDSPSTIAVMNQVTGQNDLARQIKLQNSAAQVSADYGAASFYRQSARTAMLGGALGVAGGLAGALGGGLRSSGMA